MTDDSYKTVPPLVAGVTDYEPWAANLPDWLKSAKCGIIFASPDPSKRQRFTGSRQCTQEGHPLIDTTPPNETSERHHALCEAWASANSIAAAKVRNALDDTTKAAARLPSNTGSTALAG